MIDPRPIGLPGLADPLNNVPEPDIVLTSEPEGDGLVPCESVALTVDVPDASLRFDLGEKLRRYAAGAIQEYWAADVNACVIHQMWSPNGDRFAERRTVPFGEPIAAATIPGLTIPTDRLG